MNLQFHSRHNDCFRHGDEVRSYLQSAVIFTVILVCGNSNNTPSASYPPALEWGQVSNYSTCNQLVIIQRLTVIISCCLYTETHPKYFYSETSNYLQSFAGLWGSDYSESDCLETGCLPQGDLCSCLVVEAGCTDSGCTLWAICWLIPVNSKQSLSNHRFYLL